MCLLPCSMRRQPSIPSHATYQELESIPHLLDSDRTCFHKYHVTEEMWCQFLLAFYITASFCSLSLGSQLVGKMCSYVKTLYSEEAQARHTGRSHEEEGDAHLIPGGSDHPRHADEETVLNCKPYQVLCGVKLPNQGLPEYRFGRNNKLLF